MRATFLILTALRYEALPIAKRLRLSFSSATAAAGSTSAGEPVELRVIGPRCGGLSRLDAIEALGIVIMAGLGGALDPALATGDVVVDERSELQAPEGPWRRGVIHTSADLVTTVPQKRALFAETGAQLVDMENAIARAFADRRRVPFIGVRAVSDCADEPVDPAALRWINEAGGLRPGRLAADVCRRPA